MKSQEIKGKLEIVDPCRNHLYIQIQIKNDTDSIVGLLTNCGKSYIIANKANKTNNEISCKYHKTMGGMIIIDKVTEA